MKLLYETLARRVPFFNRKPYGWPEIERLAKRERVHIKHAPYPDRIRGYYCVDHRLKRPRASIVLNDRLREPESIFVALHELIGHHMLHAPVTSAQYFWCKRNAEQMKQKQEIEADNAALIAMIPLWMLLDRDAVNYADEDPDLLPYFKKRLLIRQRYEV